MRYGFVDDEAEVLYVDATRLTFTNGRTETGIVTSVSGDEIVFRSKGRELRVRKALVSRIEPVRVEALEVHTSEELYQDHVSESPPDVAPRTLQHRNLLRVHRALRPRAWPLRAGQGTRSSFQTADVERKVEICTLKLEAKDQTEVLDAIKALTFQKKFDRALELVGEFRERFPNSALLGEALGLSNKAEEARKSWIAAKISRDFLGLLDNHAARLSRRGDIQVREAVEIMRDEVADEVFAKLARTTTSRPTKWRRFGDSREEDAGYEIVWCRDFHPRKTCA